MGHTDSFYGVFHLTMSFDLWSYLLYMASRFAKSSPKLCISYLNATCVLSHLFYKAFILRSYGVSYPFPPIPLQVHFPILPVSALSMVLTPHSQLLQLVQSSCFKLKLKSRSFRRLSDYASPHTVTSVSFGSCFKAYLGHAWFFPSVGAINCDREWTAPVTRPHHI